MHNPTATSITEAAVNLSTHSHPVQEAPTSIDNTIVHVEQGSSPQTQNVDAVVHADLQGQSSIEAASTSAMPQAQGSTEASTHSGSVTISAEEFAMIEQFKREKIERGIEVRLKNHSKFVSSRRITVALRRISLKDIAPDRDVLAYIEVCNLKSVAGQKAEATEQEMAAYLEIFSQNLEPTLIGINAIVAGK